MVERVGRYEVLVPIASGGMATVYLARLLGICGFERFVALKLIHPHLSEDPRFVADLVHEAKLMAAIRHPNVVPVLDVGQDPHGAFLVMEYVEGDSLASLIRRAAELGYRLPLAVGLRIVVDALSGLHAAHELRCANDRSLRLVHRDFTPQNILVGLDGIPRLGDFGVAQVTMRREESASGEVKGKVSYFAPEQVRGERVDRRCDIWAAGVIIWELVTGRKLYDPGTIRTLFSIASKPPPPLSQVVPNIDSGIEAVVARALAMDSRARFRTAREMAQSLRVACGSRLADMGQVAECVRRLIGATLADRNVRVASLCVARERLYSEVSLSTAVVERAPVDADRTGIPAFVPFAAAADVRLAT